MVNATHSSCEPEGKSNKLEDFNPDILKQLWCMRYLFPLDLSTKTTTTTTTTTTNKTSLKKGGGIYSNVKILENEKGVGSGGEQEEIQSLNISDMN